MLARRERSKVGWQLLGLWETGVQIPAPSAAREIDRGGS